MVGGQGGGGGRRRHCLADTPSNIRSRAVPLYSAEPFYSVFTTVLSRCRTILNSHQTYFWTLRTRPWEFGGLHRASCENSNLGGGKLVSGMMTTLFRRRPKQYLHTIARTHRTVLQKLALLRRGLGFRRVSEPLPNTADIFVFVVYKMLRFRF